MDLEHNVDAVLVQLDDLGLHRGGEAAAAGIGVQDALAVGLDLLGGEDRALAQLHLGVQVGVAELAVAFIGHAVDQRILGHLHDDIAGFPADPNVAEQAGRIKRLQAAVLAVGVVGVTGLQQHVAADRVGLDPLVAAHLDALHRAFRRGWACGWQLARALLGGSLRRQQGRR